MTRPLVPFVLPDIRNEDIEAASRVLRSGHLNEGPVVVVLEEEFKNLTGAKHAIACTSGTVALFLALRAVRDVHVRDGNTWVSDQTFFGTASAAKLACEHVDIYDDGPVFQMLADDDIVVRTHLCGRQKFLSLDHPLIIDDCCHALCSFQPTQPLAPVVGRHVGLSGLAGCFSFQSEKLIGIGQGGMVITYHDEIANRIRELKNQGLPKAKNPIGGDVHLRLGFNFRMTDYQAALALGQLRRLKMTCEIKWAAWEIWTDALRNVPGVGVHPRHDHELPLWTDILLPGLKEREAVLTVLYQIGVEVRRFYPPLHRHPPFQGRDDNFPVSTELSNRGLWLPNNSRVTPEVARRSAEVISKAVSS